MAFGLASGMQLGLSPFKPQGAVTVEPPALLPVSNLGTNCRGVVDYGSNFPFVDLMRQCRPKISGSSSVHNDGRPFDEDSDGNVLSLDTDQICRWWVVDVSLPASASPTGNYVVLYEGEGTLEYFGATRTGGAGTGRETITFSGPGLSMNMPYTNPANPLRNMRIVPVAEEASYSTPTIAQATYQANPFRSEFLDNLEPYSVLRLMDWGSTNGSEQEDWADRTAISRYSFADGLGPVPWEVMIALANTTGKHLWICVPHMATDSYVTSLATLIHSRLSANLKCFVEYSNEIWNLLFTQGTWIQAQGVALGLFPGNDYGARFRYQAQRSVEIFDLFETAFGGLDRLVRVTACQGANPSLGAYVLDWDGCAAKTDLYAIAPYAARNVDTTEDDAVVTETVHQCLDYWEDTAIQEAVDDVVASKAMLALRTPSTIPLGSYEGGQHMVGILGAENTTALTQLFTSANGHPRMYGLYLKYLDAIAEEAGSTALFCHFVETGEWSKWGSWGSRFYGTDSLATAHKARALYVYSLGTGYLHAGEARGTGLAAATVGVGGAMVAITTPAIGTGSTLPLTAVGGESDGRLLDFDFGSAIPGSVSCVRTGVATYADSSGNRQLSSTNTARKHRNRVTSRSGLLAEPGRTNSCLRSKLDGGATPTGWTVVGTATDTTSAYGSGDGGVARTFVASSSQEYLEQSITLSNNANYAWSVEIESVTGTVTNQDILLATGLPSGCTIASWLHDGVATTATTQAAVGKLALFLSGTYTGAATTFRIGCGCNASVSSAAVVLSRPQLENSEATANFATTWIPTDGSSVTRGADVLRITGTTATDAIDNAHGTLYMEFSLLEGDDNRGAYRRGIGGLASTTADDQRIHISTGGGGSIRCIAINVSSQADISTAHLAAHTPTKVAFAYAANDFRAYKDGTGGTPDTSGSLPTCDMFQLGGRKTGAGSAEIAGVLIHSLAYWDTALDNATLDTLTT